MADVANFGIKGVGSNVQLGKKGPRVKVSGGLVQFRNADDDAYINVEVLDPTTAQHAATKGYVDAVASGLDLKASVRAKTAGTETNTIDSWTGAGSGIGKTLTSPDDALANNDFDGVTLVTGNRVLVTYAGASDTVADAGNGIYELTTPADGGGQAAILTRVTDADEDAEFTSGLFTFIEEGTVHAGQGWVCTTANPITVDTTATLFTQFSDTGAQDPLYRQETFLFSDTGTNAFTVALPTNAIVQEVRIDITSAWDDEATILIDDAGGEVYMSADENDPEIACVYQSVRVGQNQIGADALQAVITDVGSPSAGTAVVHVDYVLG